MFYDIIINIFLLVILLLFNFRQFLSHLIIYKHLQLFTITCSRFHFRYLCLYYR